MLVQAPVLYLGLTVGFVVLHSGVKYLLYNFEQDAQYSAIKNPACSIKNNLMVFKPILRHSFDVFNVRECLSSCKDLDIYRKIDPDLYGHIFFGDYTPTEGYGLEKFLDAEAKCLSSCREPDTLMGYDVSTCPNTIDWPSLLWDYGYFIDLYLVPGLTFTTGFQVLKLFQDQAFTKIVVTKRFNILMTHTLLSGIKGAWNVVAPNYIEHKDVDLLRAIATEGPRAVCKALEQSRFLCNLVGESAKYYYDTRGKKPTLEDFMDVFERTSFKTAHQLFSTICVEELGDPNGHFICGWTRKSIYSVVQTQRQEREYSPNQVYVYQEEMHAVTQDDYQCEVQGHNGSPRLCTQSAILIVEPKATATVQGCIYDNGLEIIICP